MASTYTQIYIQVVFAVAGRQNLISQQYKEELQKYLTGIIRNKDQKVFTINCMPEHTHIFIGIKPSIAISNLVRDLKNNSSNFINKNRWIRGKFHWQKGFGVFSYGHSQTPMVIKYIQNQEQHHAQKSFREEYLELLKKFCIEYDEKYVFDWIREKEI